MAQSDSDTSSPDAELNSATEISTDSEFDLDPVTKHPPQIYIDDSYVKKPTKVQIKQGVIENGFSNRQYTTHNIAPKDKLIKDIHLKFKPLVQVDPDVLNTNIQPFKNPRPGDYVLNKTPSTEGIASKKSLELKKRYLLGETNLSGGIQKSGSTSILDSKLKNFHSNISECQKLLNPAAEISPTMQMFLRNTKVGENKNANNNLNNNNNNNDEKENIKIDNNRNNDSNKVNETINTTLLENKLKDLEKRQPIETIDLTQVSPKSEKNGKIIDVYDIEIPSTMIKKNQEFIENLDIKSEVIDLTTDTPVLDRSLEEQNEHFNALIPDLLKSSNLSERTKNTIDLMFDKQNDNIVGDFNENDEPRPRSPAHETIIHVPTILSWEKNLLVKSNDIESDSLSSSSSSKSSSTSSIDEIPHYILDSATSPDTQCGTNDKFIPPRVEIRDTAGELMQIDSLMIINGKYVGDPEDLKLLEKLPEGTLVPQQASSSSDDRQIKKCDTKDKSRLDYLLKFEQKKPDLKFDTRNENKIETLRSIPMTETPESGKIEKPKNLKFQEPSETGYKNHDYDKTPTIADPNPGIMKVVQQIVNEQNSDSETEITGQALTETELSDWTADDAVSENFVDIEFALNSNKGTIKRNKKKKRSAIIAKQTLSQSPSKINNSKIIQMGESLGKHLDFDNIEFMDTGSEDSCIETYSTTNKTMLKNRGYVEFVEIDYKLDPKPHPNNNKSPKVSSIASKIPINEAINKDMPKIDFIEQGACILNNDYDLETPINEPAKTILNEIRSQTENTHDSIPNDIEEDSLVMFGSQTTTTTEDSDALTVVTSPLDSYPLKLDNLSDLDRQLNSIDESKTIDKSTSEIEKFLEKTINNCSTAPASKESTKTPDEMSYEDYVRQLQTKIREISSARDSLDMRKTRRKSSKGDDQSITNPTNSINTPTKTLTLFNHQNQDLSPPTVTKKLEEITKERTKQKDLIHDLVMDKLQSKKQLNAEKRLNRSRNRNMFCSPTTVVSHNPNGPSINEIVAPLDRVLPPKLRQETERRHSLHLSTSPEKNGEIIEKGIRPLSDYLQKAITPSTPTKLSKTQSFCITSTTQNSEFRTPILPLQQQHVNKHHPPPPSRIPIKNSAKYEEQLASTEKCRQEARARARLKSNEDLGLSPEDKINLLRKRYNLDVMKLTTNKSDDMKFHEKRLMSSKSVNDITTAHKLAMDLRGSFIDTTPKSQPQTPKYSKNFNFIDNNINSISSSSSSSNNTNQMGGPTNKVVVAGKESRKGIIQTVSDFFYKKKDTATQKDGSKGELRFSGLFKLAPKSKAKEKYTPITNDHSKSESYLKYGNCSTQSSTPEKNDDIAPPIPPLPLNYHRSDDENYSMNDKEVHKKFRSISKASRQGELKRLRIAQEIQREQEEIEVKVKELEAQGVALEKALRGESQDLNRRDPTKSIGANDERLVQELLEIWRKITDLKKCDEELAIRQKELQLEHRHAQLKEELNVRLSCNKLDKSSSDIAAEGAILNEMLDIVAKRAALRPPDTISGGTSSIHSDDHTEI